MGARGLLVAGAVGLVLALMTWTRPGQGEWQGDEVAVHVIDNGFHTDLAVPRGRIEVGDGPLAQASRRVGSGDWILIGWGDARFFVDQSPIQSRLPDGARAFFRPGNASVLMLDPATGDPSRQYAPERLRTINLNATAFERLRRRVETSLALTDGRPTVSTARPDDGAWFFDSRETFSIAFLCNHWTAAVLNAAGLDIRPFRAVTSSEVMAGIDRAMVDRSAPPH